MSSTYFITGATGAVGAALVPMLLEYPDVRLKLLLRARDRDHLQQRLSDLFAFWGQESIAARERIIPLQGDIQLPEFGLDPDDYQQLSEECTHIIHCAGNVRMNLPLEEARRSSLNSAQSVIQIALECQKQGNLQKVEFVSTVGVGGRMQGGVPERFITEKREFHNTYEQAKAEAEEFIRPYVEQGLALTVHRPSMVVGDSRTGKIIHFQVFYHLCEFLSGRRTLGFMPNVQGSLLDIVPVDYAAKALAWSSRQQQTAGQVLHLCAGPKRALELMQLMHTVRRIYGSAGANLPRAKVVPLGLFKTALPLLGLFVSAQARRAMRVLPVFFAYLQERQVFENQESSEVLQNIEKEHSWDEALLHKVLNYYLQNKK